MPLKPEFAPAKINLTLEILGRRSDGYHELRSLVAFAADAGDRLTLTSDTPALTKVEGPFASALGHANLVDATVETLTRILPNVILGGLTLEKNLPVAAGIGGGSADAAAALRLQSAAHPEIAALDLHVIARTLGADVPVCLRSRSAMMTGIGETIVDVGLPGEIFAILANPLIEVPDNKTAEVFRRLRAQPLPADATSERPPVLSSIGELIRYAATRGNSLEAPARELFPQIGVMLSELAKLPRCRLAQLSGAGPTCFALFDTQQAASHGVRVLKASWPQWWVAATRLI
ncbi:4-(cytidine 5'-diphospho)-2-C-methyl-D-erythritol kinase [Hyphomicrobium sp.]|uniref:4-(cytidine 5'-diphospho)-2-C-methyl-D-erythritol kinase n=1 Tax=Hyphomicrobium sp. TaxID=82 RepID=UPI001DE01D66|nr:4-(cytidine 5'-diphospho)-2-C-methyl-D-erythritol kinase [Hyphomicrobium sp.]MBY0561161.1 4-(cytidine 5'-diphospho)-2-C-methyl-D-erythritol kinase [Hyphomicrobium sp.]